MIRKLTWAVAPLAVLGGMAFGSGAAHAATATAPTTVTATTHVTDRPDSGNGGTWAYDTFDRTLTVTAAAKQNPADTAKNLVDYTVTVTDQGFFSAVQGTGTPNQFVPGTKVMHAVKGTMNGGLSYTVTAPATDSLTGVIPASENDNFSTSGAGFVSTGDWPKLAFMTPTNVTVNENSDWSWTYKTACETWVDSAANGSGNQANDGNITGKICVTPPVVHPYVLNGKWTARAASTAQVTWDNSDKGWPSSNKCNEVYITGYGFGPIGDFADAHIGFTCDNGAGHDTGYLRGLLPNHTYALRVVPATGTYGSHQPIPGGGAGYVDVFTLSDF